MIKIKDGKKPKDELPFMVSGIKLRIIWFCVAINIIKTAFKTCHNPFKAFGFLKSLIKTRITIHNNKGKIKALKSGKRYYWSMNIPGWPSRTFNNFTYNLFLRDIYPDKNNIQTIVFAITNICPLNCIHCYESENLSDKNKLSIDDLKLIMEKIRKKGIKHIQFSGGEPLCRFDDMIELMGDNADKNDYWINTSGFGLTKEKAQIMKQKGMIGAIISLDDWDENRHNSFRNNSKSFSWVVEACKNCNEAGIIVCLSLCPVKEFVSEENLNSYFLLAKTLGAGFIRIIEPKNAGRFFGKDVLLDKQQIAIIDKFMISRNNDPAYIKYPIIQFPWHHQQKMGCLAAGNWYIYIDPNGEFHPCPFCRKPLGNAISISIDSGIAKARTLGCHSFIQKTIN